MATTIETETDIAFEALYEIEALKDLITETILQSTDQLSSCVVSYAYVAIQKFIAHCKDHNINPLQMSYDDIKEFVDSNLKKELDQEIKLLR